MKLQIVIILNFRSSSHTSVKLLLNFFMNLHEICYRHSPASSQHELELLMSPELHLVHHYDQVNVSVGTVLWFTIYLYFHKLGFLIIPLINMLT